MLAAMAMIVPMVGKRRVKASVYLRPIAQTISQRPAQSRKSQAIAVPPRSLNRQVLSRPLFCQRIGPDLDMHGARPGAFAALHQPWNAIAARAPEPAALPAGIRIIDAAVETFGKKAQRIGHAQHDHLAVLEGDETVVEVGGGDRNILAEADRVVMIDPGVIARLGARVLEPFEARARIFEIREALRAVVAGRVRAVQRVLAFLAIESDQAAVRARAPEHAVPVDVSAANADAFLRDGVKFGKLCLWIEA